jgi:hypothetical protein
MELYFFRPDEFNRLYNCDNISVDIVPVTARQSPILGSILMALFIILYVIFFCFQNAFIPCPQYVGFVYSLHVLLLEAFGQSLL